MLDLKPKFKLKTKSKAEYKTELKSLRLIIKVNVLLKDL